MRYEFFKLVRDWTFWTTILLSIVVIVAFSINYVNNGTKSSANWNYTIARYSSNKEIDEQIADEQESLKRIESQIESCKDDEELSYMKETINGIEKSIAILTFLKENSNKYNYYNIEDGTSDVYLEKSSRSFSEHATGFVFAFQIVAIIFIVGQTINQGKSSGTYAFSLLMRKRKKMFFRGLFVSIIWFTFIYCIQIGLISIIKTFFNDKIEYLLYFPSTGIKVVSGKVEEIEYVLFVYVWLLFFVGLVFLLAHIFNRISLFTICSLVIAGGLGFFLLFVNVPALEMSMMSISDVFAGTESLTEYICWYIIKLVICILFIFAAYLIDKKRNLEISYGL